MVKKATGTTKRNEKQESSSTRKPGKAVTATSRANGSGGGGREDDGGISEALIKLLQSPLVADLLAVAATAALAERANNKAFLCMLDRIASPSLSSAEHSARRAADALIMPGFLS